VRIDDEFLRHTCIEFTLALRPRSFAAAFPLLIEVNLIRD
jgi:hypothetical protein